MSSGRIGPDVSLFEMFSFIDPTLALEGLSNPYQPFCPLKPPPLYAELLKEVNIFVNPIVAPTEHEPNEKNRTILGRIKKTGSDTIRFAKKHPFLTAMFALGVIFLLMAFPSITAAFIKTGVTVFHAHVVVGIGLVAIVLYYGITLINMARRAAQKQLLETKIEAFSPKKQSLSKAKIEEIKKSARIEAQKIRKNKSEELKTLNAEKAKNISDIEKIQRSLKMFKKAQSDLQKKIDSTVFSQLPQELKQKAQQIYENMADEIIEGQKICLEAAGEPEEFEFPDISSLLASIEKPEEPTTTQEKNRETQKTIGQRLAKLFQSIGTFIRKHPGSAFIILIGVLFTVLAIPALCYWASGVTSLYGFGTITGLGVAQLLLYGLSIIYEGYNSAAIKKLKERSKEIQREIAENEESTEKIEKTTEQIQTLSKDKLDAYTKSWDSIISTQKKLYDKEVKTIASKIKTLTIECNSVFMDILTHFFEKSCPESSEVSKTISSFEHGAHLL